MLSVEQVEKAIGCKAETWRGHCHEISAMILGAKLVEGILRYGHWLGYVHPKSIFANRLPVIRHGWIERLDGSIVDATRFEFEQAEPYIYEGKNDCYDAGGNVWRLEHLQPPPPFCAPPEQQHIIQNPEVFDFIKHMDMDFRIQGCNVYVTMKQLFWLANLPLQALGKSAKAIYKEILYHNYGAFIPYDNRNIVLRDENPRMGCTL